MIRMMLVGLGVGMILAVHEIVADRGDPVPPAVVRSATVTPLVTMAIAWFGWLVLKGIEGLYSVMEGVWDG